MPLSHIILFRAAILWLYSRKKHLPCNHADFISLSNKNTQLFILVHFLELLQVTDRSPVEKFQKLPTETSPFSVT